MDARIVSDWNNEELEQFFGVKVARESEGITIAVSPRCEAQWAYVRTKDIRWTVHNSRKIVVSRYLQEWLKSGIILGNGTHERFHNMGIERDIDVLICGNYEANKNIEATLEKAKAYGQRIVWFGRATRNIPGCEAIASPPVADIPYLYNRARVFITASKDEGWGRPVAEAMSCGVPTIINENGGNRDIEIVTWESIANQLIKILWQHSSPQQGT